jgi:hypothetical protein
LPNLRCCKIVPLWSQHKPSVSLSFFEAGDKVECSTVLRIIPRLKENSKHV